MYLKEGLYLRPNPNDSIEYLIEEQISSIALWRDSPFPNGFRFYKAKNISDNTYVFIKCYDATLLPREDQKEAWKKKIAELEQANSYFDGKTKFSGFLKKKSVFEYLHPYNEGDNQLKSICFVLEYIEGETLHQKIKEVRESGNSLSWDNLKKYLRDIEDLIKYIHGKRLVLQFLTPDNIWISKENKAYIVNFDTTVEFRDVTAGSVDVADKTPFSHPKSNDRDGSGLMTATNENDIYSLGGILYYALSSIEPRGIWRDGGENSKDLPPLNNVNTDIDAAIRKALTQGLTNRYSNLYDFYEDLGLYKESSLSDSSDSSEKIALLILQVKQYAIQLSKLCKANPDSIPSNRDSIEGFCRVVAMMVKDVVPKSDLESQVSMMINTIVPNSKSFREVTPNKKSKITWLPIPYYLWLFSGSILSNLLPSLFILPTKFTVLNSDQIWGSPHDFYYLACLCLAILAGSLNKTLLLIGLLFWIVCSCLIVSIAYPLNLLWLLISLVIAFTVVNFLGMRFKGFSDLSRNLESELKYIRSKRQSLNFAWDISGTILLGFLTVWLLLPLFSR